jgi:hypothetical protein
MGAIDARRRGVTMSADTTPQLDADGEPDKQNKKRRRRLLGLEPIFEGGWLHKGRRGQRWDVEPELVAFALFGDVTVDLAHARSTPSEVRIRAWALLRDVDIIVAPHTRVELSGGGIRGHIRSEASDVSAEQATSVVYVEGHTLLTDVTVTLARS